MGKTTPTRPSTSSSRWSGPARHARVTVMRHLPVFGYDMRRTA